MSGEPSVDPVLALETSSAVRDALMATFHEFTERLHSGDSESVSGSKLFGILVGARGWIATFVAFEEEVMPLLGNVGISPERFKAVCRDAASEGKSVLELAKSLRQARESGGREGF